MAVAVTVTRAFVVPAVASAHGCQCPSGDCLASRVSLSIPHAGDSIRRLARREVSRKAGPPAAEVVREEVEQLGGQADLNGTERNGKVAQPLDVPEVKAVDEKFVWEENWFPAAIIEDLEPNVPKAQTILGVPMVLWYDRVSGAWKAFVDKCPHRLAPLSEGRIHESGQLQCSYHGWTFDGSGNCGTIPQADNEALKASKRACAQAIPVREQQGLLFVWPDLKQGNHERAAAKEAPRIPDLDDPEFTPDMMMRDFGYGGDTLIENLMDPAHVPFAHHKIKVAGRAQGNRAMGGPIPLDVHEITKNGYTGGGRSGSKSTFVAPVFYRTEVVLPAKPEDTKEKKLSFNFYCVPTSPGNSKLFFSFPNNFLPKAAKLYPQWLFHIERLLFLDSDLYFLHVQERTLETIGPKNWAKSCYPATESDAYVIAYRKWLNKFSDGVIGWGPNIDPKLPPTPSKEQLMDRYTSHVQQCHVCRQAKQNFDKLKDGLLVASFVVLSILAFRGAVDPNPVPVPLALGTVALSASLAFASRKLNDFIYKSYHFHDYNHAMID